MPTTQRTRARPIREGFYQNPQQQWLEVVSTFGGQVSYNCSGVLRWANGAKSCSKDAFRKLLSAGNYRRASRTACFSVEPSSAHE